MFSEELNITLGDSMTYYMTSSLIENFKFFVPELNDTMTEILINFDLFNYYDLTEGY